MKEKLQTPNSKLQKSSNSKLQTGLIVFGYAKLGNTWIEPVHAHAC
jgi:hypothetical protein